ncbi:MAG TPA: M28 family peptidase, partial [Candidatus Acidoferrum sp.]|nr:M28 family peptidase [Candidatus Acidoferrum sp.]
MAEQQRNRNNIAGPITFALLILIGLLAIHSLEPPSVVDTNVPIGEFSAARAMDQVRAIAKKPHPLGSAENERVRMYLFHHMYGLVGGRPMPFGEEVTVARHIPFGPDTWAKVTNMGVILDGADPTGAVLMVAHYDSVPSGPGAGDNAASVGALLETLGALRLSGRDAPRNHLIILFTDGEELGMLGAKGFVEDRDVGGEIFRPGDIKVVLNFDMRGDEGPSMMFQTSSHNSWLIDQLAAAPFPYTSSAASAVYKMLPSDTDLTVFLDAGIPGMNFAGAGGITRYHTALDTVDLLDQRTLQHQGTYALSMARQFGSIDLNHHRSDDAVFFVVGDKLIHYTARLAIPLALLVTILVGWMLWVGIRDGRFSVGGIGAGSAIYAFAIAASLVEAGGVWWLMKTLAGWRMLPVGTTYGGYYFSVAAVALIFGTLWAAYTLISRSISLRTLGAGAIAILTALTLVTSIAFAPGSYIFTWPLLFAALAMGIASSATGVRSAILTLIALAPGTLMLVPSFAAVDGTMPFFLLSALATVLLFGLFIPYIDFLTVGQRWVVPGVLGVLAIVLIIKGNAASNFDASHPHPDSIFYFQDTDRARARWVSLDPRPDKFTAQFFQHHVRAGWMPKLDGLATKDTPASNLANISKARDFA